MGSETTPFILSPTSSVSTPSTPGAGSAVWDTSETPLRPSSTQSGFELSTPLTSPVTPDDFQQTFEPRTKPRVLPIADHISPTQTVALNLGSSPKHRQSVRTSPIPDVIAPGQLFRNCRSLLLEIANNSPSTSQIPYISTPLIDFCFTPEFHSSNNATFVKRENKDARPQIKNRNTKTGSAIVITPHVKSIHKGLQAVLEHVIPSEVHTRINDDPKLCVASYVGNPNERCNRKSLGQLTDYHEILKTISRCIEKGNYAILPEYLEQLVKVLLCGTHRNVALYQPKAKPRIEKLQDFILGLPQASEADLSIFRAWTMALADRSLSPPTHCSARADSLTTRTPKINITAAFRSNEVSELPEFLPYKPMMVNDLAITKALKNMITKLFTKPDMKDGFISIFWNQGSFVMVKTYRINNLERRLKEWNNCKSTHSYHKSSRDGELPIVPHVQHVERLMQIELVNFRKTRACENCAKTKLHKEWFNIPEAKAVEVLQKWRNWILQQPYAEDDQRKWMIRPEMLEALPENCILEPKKAQGQRARPRTVNNRSKGPVLRRSPARKVLGAT